MNLARKFLGRTLFHKLMRSTFYGQFVAGEDKEDIKEIISRNRLYGVKSILDYSVEEDVTREEAEAKVKYVIVIILVFFPSHLLMISMSSPNTFPNDNRRFPFFLLILAKTIRVPIVLFNGIIFLYLHFI